MIQASTSARTQTSGRQTVPMAPLKPFTKVSPHLPSTLLDHLAKNNLTVILGTFTVLYVVKIPSKRQATRNAYQQYECHFVDGEIKAKKPKLPAPRMVIVSELGLPFPISSPICFILLASTWLSKGGDSQHMQQLPSSLQGCKQTSKIQFHWLLQSEAINIDQILSLKPVTSSNCDMYQHSNAQEAEAQDLLEDRWFSTSVITALTINSEDISDMHMLPTLTNRGPFLEHSLSTPPWPNSLPPEETKAFIVSHSYPLTFLNYVWIKILSQWSPMWIAFHVHT